MSDFERLARRCPHCGGREPTLGNRCPLCDRRLSDERSREAWIPVPEWMEERVVVLVVIVVVVSLAACAIHLLNGL